MQKQRSNFLPGNIIRLTLAVGGIFILLALLLTLTPSNRATANSTDKSLAITKYPSISGTRLDSCSLCHTSNIPALNPYGSAYLNNGRNLNAFGLIENTDSDSDGFKNLQEITALYFPGDANDHPPAATATSTQAAQLTPTRTTAPTATRTSTAVPPIQTRTSTSVLPTPTRTSTSVPPTPTRTNTSLPSTPTQTNTTAPATLTQTSTAQPPASTQTNTAQPPPPTSTYTPAIPTQIDTPNEATPTSTSLPPTKSPTNTAFAPTATTTIAPPTATPATQLPIPTEPMPTPGEKPDPTALPKQLDIDIRSLSITPRLPLGINKLVIIRAQIVRVGGVAGEATLTITGTQNGLEIYHGSQVVVLNEKREPQWFSFPGYMPTQIGIIHWKVEVLDNDPDNDIKTATTRVNSHTENNRGKR
jgi:hypothetical protein